MNVGCQSIAVIMSANKFLDSMHAGVDQYFQPSRLFVYLDVNNFELDPQLIMFRPLSHSDETYVYLSCFISATKTQLESDLCRFTLASATVQPSGFTGSPISCRPTLFAHVFFIEWLPRQCRLHGFNSLANPGRLALSTP